MPHFQSQQWRKRPKPEQGIIVRGEGPTPCHIMLVGERPGEDEARMGRPFVGASGRELDRYLEQAAQISRERIYVTNLVKTYDQNNTTPTATEIAEWMPAFADEFSRVRPKVVAAVGRLAARALLGDVDMEVVHGIPHYADDRGGAFIPRGTVVVPLYHPAAGLYDTQVQALCYDDARQLGRVIRGEYKPQVDAYPTPEYTVSPLRVVGSPLVSVDTEGLAAKPWCVTWSIRPGTARLSHEGVNFASSHVLLHNSLHDLGVLRAMGKPLHSGQFTDTMVLAYLLCLEPQGLKALAYRHAGMEMQSYAELVEGPNREHALAYLLNALEEADARPEWQESQEYCILETDKNTGQLAPKIKKPWSLARSLARLASDYQKDSATVDIRKRLGNWDDAKAGEIEAVLGPIPEATLDDVDYEVAKDYACRDADATLRIYPVLQAKIEDMGLVEVSAMDHAIIPMVDRMQEVGFGVSLPRLAKLQEKVEAGMSRLQHEIQVMTGALINPDSGDQVAALLFDQLKLPVGKLTKGGDRGSTNDKVLESLAATHPVIPLITDYRELSKIRNSFCRAIPRWVDDDGRVRCNIRITRVSSGRLAATNPNLLAIPVRTELGKEVRDAFEAPDGRLLTSHDLDQVEMRQMAHESQDQFMCTLFQEGKRDIHRETAALMFGIKPQDVHPLFHRYPAKRVGFGVITGITGAGLVDQMALAHAIKADGSLWTEDDCDRLIVEWFKIYPAARIFMDRCRAEALRFGYVRDMWGRIRYLPGVWSAIPRIREEALRQSHSHKIQAGAQGIIKRAMAEVWWWIEHQWAGRVDPLLQIHDELIHEIPEAGLWDEFDSTVTSILCGAATLRVPLKAKGSSAKTWGQLKD